MMSMKIYLQQRFSLSFIHLVIQIARFYKALKIVIYCVRAKHITLNKTEWFLCFLFTTVVVQLLSYV